MNKPKDIDDTIREAQKAGIDPLAIIDQHAKYSDCGYAEKTQDLMNGSSLSNDTGDFMIDGLQFDKNYVAPTYMLGGILQKGYLYAVTGHTGAGKTAFALMVMAHMITGKSLGERAIKQGEGLYIAADNETDVNPRWVATREHMKISDKTQSRCTSSDVQLNLAKR